MMILRTKVRCLDDDSDALWIDCSIYGIGDLFSQPFLTCNLFEYKSTTLANFESPMTFPFFGMYPTWTLHVCE